MHAESHSVVRPDAAEACTRESQAQLRECQSKTSLLDKTLESSSVHNSTQRRIV